MDLNPITILPHWPFLAASAVLYLVIETLKSGPLSAKQAKKVPWVRSVRRWFPLPLFSILLGGCLGLIPDMPVSPGVENPVLYYLAAGAAAVLGRNIFREFSQHGVKS